MRSDADWLACAGPQAMEALLEELSDNAILALPYLFEFWAMAHQLPPEGEWRTWVILGGRGAGKTRAGAEWVRAMVEGARPLDTGRARRVALVGETYDQVREVMVFGESGIVACCPPDRRPRWEATRRRLVWPNGATAQAFSASEPEAMRGPQFDAAWVDELAKWKKGQAAWDMLQFALRLGADPRAVVTTTPRAVGVLKAILGDADTVTTKAATTDNRANLAESFLRAVAARYGGTRLGRQEIEGELIEDAEGALWTHAMIDAARRRAVDAPGRVVVAVDPPVTGHAGSDACGIVVAGAETAGPPELWRGQVIADESIAAASPNAWAQAVVEAYHRHGADRVVAEVNQGGDLVEAMLRQVDPLIPVRKVRASRGKAARAEPVAALYEQGRVAHAAGLEALEDQLTQMTLRGYVGRGSPDRADALVWALTDLLIDAARAVQRPQVRGL